MDFGVFDHLDRGDTPLHDYYENRLRLIEAYDRAGFFAYHIAEHHATPLGMAPSPSVFLAAVAQRTKRLRFGPLIYALPLYHPIRLAEEICMLDQMSGGRLEMGFGRGASPIELRLYGQRPEDAEAVYTEALEVILRCLTERTLSYDGRFFSFDDVPMELEPLQKPHPPMWYGVHSPDSAARAAKKALNIVSLDNAADTRGFADSYRAAWAAGGGAADAMPRIGMSRFIVVSEDGEEARAAARSAYPKWHESFNHLFRAYGSAPRHPRPPEWDAMAERCLAVAGSPEEVGAFLQREVAESDITYLVGQFAFGDLPPALTERSVALFAERVMPALGG